MLYGSDRVLILESEDEFLGSDKYFGFQNNKMVLYGNKDDEIEKVIGDRPPIRGKYIEDLKMESDTKVVDFSASNVKVDAQLEESVNNSVQDIQGYQIRVNQLLEMYSKRISQISDNPFSSHQEKIKELNNLDGWFENENQKLGVQYGIAETDIEEIKEDALNDFSEIEDDYDPDEERHKRWVQGLNDEE